VKWLLRLPDRDEAAIARIEAILAQTISPISDDGAGPDRGFDGG
jgi:hypothetical protein